MARRETEPFVHPDVQQSALAPAAATVAYQAGIQARRGGRLLPKTTDPVAGGPTPAIPRLDAPHHAGMTMAQQAEAMASRQPSGPTSFVEMPPPTPGAGAPTPANLGLLPVDMLTAEAQRDPEFQQGHGSMYAAAQPRMALKYGVMRNGQYIPPQKLGTNRPQLRNETVRDLEALAALQRQAPDKVGALHSSDQEADDQVAAGPAGAAARVGNAIGDSSNAPVTDEEKKRINDAVEKMDEFDFDSFRQAMMRDILNNPEQKEIIEARLEPLSIDDLITRNYVKQVVPIVPGRFSVTFRSMSGEEDLSIKRLIMQESKSVEISDRYLLDKYAFMTIAIGLVEVNGKPLGVDVTNDKGEFDDKKFWDKYTRILRLPLHMLASIGLNQLWFEQRVRKLFVAEKVGNG